MAKVLVIVLVVTAGLALRLGWEVLARTEGARPAMSTSAVAQKTDEGDLAASEDAGGLVCEDFGSQEEAQEEFDVAGDTSDLDALDPDNDGEVCEEEFGGSPGDDPGSEGPSGSPGDPDEPPDQPGDSPGGANGGQTGGQPPERTTPAPPPPPAPRPQPAPTPQPDRDQGELMNAGGPQAGPVPKMPGSGCPKEFPEERGGACYS